MSKKSHISHLKKSLQKNGKYCLVNFCGKTVGNTIYFVSGDGVVHTALLYNLRRVVMYRVQCQNTYGSYCSPMVLKLIRHLKFKK